MDHARNHPKHIVLTFEEDVTDEILQDTLNAVDTEYSVGPGVRGYIAYDDGFGRLVQLNKPFVP